MNKLEKASTIDFTFEHVIKMCNDGDFDTDYLVKRLTIQRNSLDSKQDAKLIKVIQSLIDYINRP